MRRTDYYNDLKQLASDIRQRYSLSTENISLTSIRAVYKEQSIVVDYWKPKLKKVRAAYMLDDDDVPHVLVNANIKPVEPRIFSLVHELKHHYKDRQYIKEHGFLGCKEISWSHGSEIEIGAEIFAAELIYPESEFLKFAGEIGISPGTCSDRQVVQFKRECGAAVSYKFITKRLEWFEYIPKGAFVGIQFQKLEEQIYGPPLYKKILQRRQQANRYRTSS